MNETGKKIKFNKSIGIIAVLILILIIASTCFILFNEADKKQDIINEGIVSTTQIMGNNLETYQAKIETVNFDKTNVNYVDGIKYIKAGTKVVTEITFDNELSSTPTVELKSDLEGREEENKVAMTVTKKENNKWEATYEIAKNEENLLNGKLSFIISNYKSNDNEAEGEAVIKETGMIFDSVAPQVDVNDIELSHKADDVNNPDWRNQQSVIIKKVTDNIINESEIKFEYWWELTNTGTREPEDWKDGTIGETITKEDGNGIYNFHYKVTDYAGNYTLNEVGPFYLDTIISDNEMGKLVATRKDGSIYNFKEKQNEDGTKYYEGAYLNQDIYITKEDGESNLENESGHSKTSYGVKEIQLNEDGTYIELDTAVGSDSKGNAILYRGIDYLVKLTSEDKANPKNVRTENYIIHKGQNIKFSPDGQANPVAKQDVVVTLTDNNNNYSNIGYAWVEEKDGKVETPNTWDESISVDDFKEGTTISSPKGVNGNYYLFVKTVDENGNTNIVKSDVYSLRGQIQNLGQIEFRTNDENGEEIVPNEENVIKTKEDIWINIKNQGSDEYGIVKTTFGIKQGEDATQIGALTLERAELKDEGVYTLSIISTRTNIEHPELNITEEDTNAITYTIYVDKTAPKISFEKATQDNSTQGKIKVTIKDNEGISEAQSEVNESNLRYYWTNGNYKPTKDDFFAQEDEFRGKITSTTQTITAPKDVSGIWVLWVYAEDNVGNVTIVQDRIISENDTVLDNDAPVAGKIETTIVDGETEEEYKVGTDNEEAEFTNKDVKIKLLAGYDATSGVSSNTYKIVKDGKSSNRFKTLKTNPDYVENSEETKETENSDETEETENSEETEEQSKYIEENANGNIKFDEEIILTEHGIYTVTVTTIDNAQSKHTSTREYTIKIDKKGPQIENEPNGNTEYAKQHETKIIVTEPETEVGVDETKTKCIWVGIEPTLEDGRNEISAKIKEFAKTKLEEDSLTWKNAINEITKEENIKELEEMGIYVIPTAVGETIKTPADRTLKFVLFTCAEDKLGNFAIKLSKEFYTDNIAPTKPTIRGIKPELIGTTIKGVPYYGEVENKDITVVAENSKSLSGVDKYEYTYTTDNGENWSEWQDGTYKTEEEVKGRVQITQEGRTVVKFRSIAELLDGTLVSEETEEFTVVINKTGPTITFANTENGENGSKENTESAKVRVTVTDEQSVSDNTLKYNWVKFESVEEFEQFKNSNNTLEALKEKMDVENAKNFSNGEPIPSPSDVEGIYSLFVYAEDTLGNSNVSYSEYYALNLAKEEKSPYELEGKYITKVLPETTTTQFIDKVKALVAGKEYIVYDKQGKELKEEKLVTTDSTVKIDGVEYKIVVMGDLDGNGKLTITDLVRMRQNAVGKIKFEGAYQKAADINVDTKITITDLVRIRQILAGLASFED